MLAVLRRVLCALVDAVAASRYREVERAIDRMYGSTDLVLSDEVERQIARLYTPNSSFPSNPAN
jgi:hypothetical protein